MVIEGVNQIGSSILEKRSRQRRPRPPPDDLNGTVFSVLPGGSGLDVSLSAGVVSPRDSKM